MNVMLIFSKNKSRRTAAADEDGVLGQAVGGHHDIGRQAVGGEGRGEGVERGPIHRLGRVDHVRHAAQVERRLGDTK